jgi:tricorn protease
VDPDIRVDEDPAQLAKGHDPQLERAIEEIQNALKTYRPGPKRPEYERRIPATPTTARKTGQ